MYYGVSFFFLLSEKTAIAKEGLNFGAACVILILGSIHSLGISMLLGIFKNVVKYVADLPKALHFWRI